MPKYIVAEGILMEGARMGVFPQDHETFDDLDAALCFARGRVEVLRIEREGQGMQIVSTSFLESELEPSIEWIDDLGSTRGRYYQVVAVDDEG